MFSPCLLSVNNGGIPLYSVIPSAGWITQILVINWACHGICSCSCLDLKISYHAIFAGKYLNNSSYVPINMNWIRICYNDEIVDSHVSPLHVSRFLSLQQLRQGISKSCQQSLTKLESMSRVLCVRWNRPWDTVLVSLPNRMSFRQMYVPAATSGSFGILPMKLSFTKLATSNKHV